MPPSQVYGNPTVSPVPSHEKAATLSFRFGPGHQHPWLNYDILKARIAQCTLYGTVLEECSEAESDATH